MRATPFIFSAVLSLAGLPQAGADEFQDAISSYAYLQGEIPKDFGTDDQAKINQAKANYLSLLEAHRLFKDAVARNLDEKVILSYREAALSAIAKLEGVMARPHACTEENKVEIVKRALKLRNSNFRMDTADYKNEIDSYSEGLRALPAMTLAGAQRISETRSERPTYSAIPRIKSGQIIAEQHAWQARVDAEAEYLERQNALQAEWSEKRSAAEAGWRRSMAVDAIFIKMNMRPFINKIPEPDDEGIRCMLRWSAEPGFDRATKDEVTAALERCRVYLDFAAEFFMVRDARMFWQDMDRTVCIDKPFEYFYGESHGAGSQTYVVLASTNSKTGPKLAIEGHGKLLVDKPYEIQTPHTRRFRVGEFFRH